MKKILFGLSILVALNAKGQQINGNFSGLAQQRIVLYGFEGLNAYMIDSATLSSDGKFTLSYNANDKGMAYLQSENNSNFILVLDEPKGIAIQGENLQEAQEVEVLRGQQNLWFGQYAREYPIRDQALGAWERLLKMYIEDSLFTHQAVPQRAMAAEIDRLKTEDSLFIAQLPEDSYVKWFLPIRTLVSSVYTVARYRPEKIPATLAAFRNLDYADERLYKSGLFKEALENHMWFIENSSGALEKVYEDLNTSVDIILDQLTLNEGRYNEVTGFLFNLFEKRSLFDAAEYLSLKVLNENSCTLEGNIANQLEAYRKMAVGKVLPDIKLGDATYYPEGEEAQTLNEICAKNKSTLVIFAAGWCPHCTAEIPKIADLYPEAHAKGLEVVLVSLDENPEDFAGFAAPLPFISTTDYQKWESPVAKDYHVYATPTYFLLNEKQELLIRIKSVEHLKAWVEQKM